MNENTNQLFYLCLASLGIILALLAMFFNYSLKLGDRTATLEKKNGYEQKQIDQLKQQEIILFQRIKQLEGEIHQLQRAYQASQKKLQKYERN
jgi:cell division protein FtsB